MYTVTRLSLDDGSGWGVRVDWVEDTRRMLLEIFSVQYPLRVPNGIALYNWPACGCYKCWWPRAKVLIGPRWRTGSLFISKRVQVSPHEVLVRSPEQEFTIPEPGDVKRLYAIARAVRKSGDGGYVLVDAFTELFGGVPEIATCLAFRPSGPPPHADPSR